MATRRNHIRLIINLLATAAVIAAFLGVTAARPVLRQLSFSDDFQSGKLDAWQFPYPEDWTILAEGPRHFLHMKRNREPGVPRRPLQFALLKGPEVGSFEFETLVRREGRSMLIVFNYVDTLHFYYVHLSADRGTEQPVHNGIFIVNGEPRKRIAGTEAPTALPDGAWHKVRLVRDAARGSIEVFMDNQPKPLFSTQDRTFTCGQIGLGSFDETGDFADVRLESQDVGCEGKHFVRPASTN